MIRARFKLFRRVKAITAEAKWSGMFLSVFPIGALVMINILQPNYYDEREGDRVFHSRLSRRSPASSSRISS